MNKKIRLDVSIMKKGNVHCQHFDVTINNVHRICRNPTALTTFLLRFIYPIRFDHSSVATKFWKNKFGELEGRILEVMLENDKPLTRIRIIREAKYGLSSAWTGRFCESFQRLRKRDAIFSDHDRKYHVSRRFLKRHPFVILRHGKRAKNVLIRRESK